MLHFSARNTFAVLLLAVSAGAFAAGSAPQPSICTRSCWGASSGSTSYMSALTRAIVHHTAGNEYNTTGLEDSKADVRAIQSYHKSLGWGDIGYHFLVDKFGNIFEGRIGSMGSLPRGAHDGTNTNSFGFNIMGYYHPSVNNVPTAASLNSLYSVIAWRMPSAWRPHGSPGVYGPLGNSVGYVDGHRRVKATACPGDHIFNPYMGTNMNAGTIRSEILNRINGSGSATITIDNNSGGFAASANWATGTSAADKFGADYRYRPTEAISDQASWTGNVTIAGTYTISAWWSQGTNRTTNAVYTLPGGGTSAKNQQSGGGVWNSLGSVSLGTGNQVTRLSCWATTGFVVIADAVRYVKP